MNKIILIGRLTADPQLSQTKNGISCCRFTVAVNRKYADKSTGERQADFLGCQAWRQTAEFIDKYFFKGSMICIEGTLQNNNYEKDGVKHYSNIIQVDAAEFCGSKNDNSSQQQNEASAELDKVDYAEFESLLDDGDVPF